MLKGYSNLSTYLSKVIEDNFTSMSASVDTATPKTVSVDIDDTSFRELMESLSLNKPIYVELNVTEQHHIAPVTILKRTVSGSDFYYLYANFCTSSVDSTTKRIQLVHIYARVNANKTLILTGYKSQV